MSPRKGIVKTGNAGNSSKPAKILSISSNAPDTEKPLFPLGYKYPLSLLQEKCQKLDWEKPIVETHHHPGKGHSFVVTLSQTNKKTSKRETVRLEPHPAYYRATAAEARHWGATYALYRFCNGIPYKSVLPPGPREYWIELADHHKSIPEHQKWMYDADPFMAQREVKERQTKAAQKHEGPSSQNPPRGSPHVTTEFSQSPEVRMASSLRDTVEDAVKKGIALFPEAVDESSSVISEIAIPQISKQLIHLGFNKAQTQSAVEFLSQSSVLASHLLGSLSPIEASIEYLMLHIPECDLPPRFLPSQNSSNPFITSVHTGAGDLQKRWVGDKAVKEGGWPRHIVNEYLDDVENIKNWDRLMVTLGKRLIGENTDLSSPVTPLPPFVFSIEEYEALGANMDEDNHIIMPMYSTPVQLHILLSPDGQYPRPDYVPLYITSVVVPAYVRLHLLSQLLEAISSDGFIEPGEGFCMAAMRLLENEWAKLEDSGPPEMVKVMKHLLPPSDKVDAAPLAEKLEFNKARRTRNRPNRNENRDDEQIKREFEGQCQSEKYSSILATRRKLPAFDAEKRFLDLLNHNRVVVVVGDTGCGKTTQLPQFILDSLILSNQGSTTSILITQPRRISAIAVAARVSYERVEDGSVGYAIRGESKQTTKTKLLFCTTGVVLRRLGSGDSLQDISHVVVDEVHERSVDGDFLLLELKHLLKRHPTLKVVLMSATINHETFIKYYDNAPLLTIPGFTHPVVDIYLEEIIPQIGYQSQIPRQQKADSQDNMARYERLIEQGLDPKSATTIQNITRSNQIDYQLIAAVVSYILSTVDTVGGILIFLPGVNEIRQAIDAIRNSIKQSDADILPLHANLSNDEQRRVFEKTSRWKIVAATNVAETSITIDDIIYVVDTGKVKENQYDQDLGLSRLVETWVTQAAARQRRGRAGRTRPGTCYKLYTRNQEASMAKYPIPEILRIPLESISLTVKAMRQKEDVKSFLTQAIDPPKIEAIDNALSVLEDLGAVDESGNLTPLGKHISMLPVDVRLAKMLILGTVFQCLGPILTIAASLSSKSLFLNPLDKREEATKARARFSTARSDLLTDLSAYDACVKLQNEGALFSTIRKFCEDNFISASTVREITTLRREFISSLSDLGFIPFQSNPNAPELNVNSENTNLLKAVVLGGLWPRVARVHLPKAAIKFDKVQAGTVQRENTAREFKMFDLKEGRVFLHPGCLLFDASVWKSPFLVYFHKYMTTKVFLRDATEVPLYALLLFGGQVSVNHVAGGVTIGKQGSYVKLRAWPRIGVLVNQLRRLLDAQLERCIEQGTMLNTNQGNPVVKAILELLTFDGLTE